jgi:hypothetical protein
MSVATVASFAQKTFEEQMVVNRIHGGDAE